MKRFVFLSLLLLVMGGLAACAEDAPDTSAAAEAVEEYWNARIGLDEDAVLRLTCAEREAQVPGEVESLRSVSNLRIEGMACAVSGEDGDDVLVTCEGSIFGDYGTGDVNEFPLRTYRTVSEDGAWKYCGEAANPNVDESG